MKHCLLIFLEVFKQGPDEWTSEMLLGILEWGREVGQDGLFRASSSSEILRLAKENPYATNNKIPQF